MTATVTKRVKRTRTVPNVTKEKVFESLIASVENVVVVDTESGRIDK